MTTGFWIETAIWAVPALWFVLDSARGARSWKAFGKGVGSVVGIAAAIALLTSGRGCAPEGVTGVDCDPVPHGAVCKD